jgi:hypothetical protein
MLEPYETKVSRTVLRRGRASNRSFLFGTARWLTCASFEELILKNISITKIGARINGAKTV